MSTYFWTPEQRQIRESVMKLCERFDDQYWLERDETGEFPEDFCQAMADDGDGRQWQGVHHCIRVRPYKEVRKSNFEKI